MTPAARLAPALRYHPVYVRRICALLESRGQDIPALLASAGLKPHAITSHAAQLGHREVHALMRQARAQSPDPLLGLELGACLGGHAHGTVGTAIYSSATVRDGIRTLVQLVGLRASTAVPRWRDDGQDGLLELSPAVPFGDLHDFLFDSIAAMAAHMLRPLLEQALDEVVAHMPCAPPPWQAEYPRYLGCQVQWGAPLLRFVIPQRLLDLPCPLADGTTHLAAMRQCQVDALCAPDGMAAKVAALLSRSAGPLPSLAQAAAQLYTSSRTLSRALRAEGVRYQVLLDQARRHEADRLLQGTALAVEQVAQRLGYADTTGFIRAFRRWHGSTPGAYRAQAVPAGA